MADERIVLELDLETGKVISEFNQVERKAKTSGKKAGDNFSDGFSRGLGDLATKASQIGAVLGAAFAGFATKGAFEAARSIESIETRFEVLLGSAGDAKKQVKELVDFAATTPFQLEGISEAAAQLLSFGFQQKELQSTLRTLGDIAAGTNKPLQEFSLVLGQIRAAGKLTGERLLQLQERGANIAPALAKNLGVAESSIRSLVSAGKVGFDDVTNALRTLTEEGGIFADATQKQSETLNGLVSTLSDNFFALQVAIGEALGPAFKTILKESISFLKDLTQQVRENRDAIQSAFIQFSRYVNDYVIAPFELITNVFKVAQQGINTWVAAVVAGYGFVATKAADLLEKFGVGGEYIQGLRDFGETSKEVLDENTDKLKKNVDDIFKGTLYGDTSSLIDRLQKNLETSRTVIATQGNVNLISQVFGSALAEPLVLRVLPEMDPQASQMIEESTPEIPKGFQTLSQMIKELPAAMGATEKQLKDSMVKVGKAAAFLGQQIKKGIGQGIGSGFAAFGKALVEGENALDAFAKAFLGSLGQLMIQQGTAFILQGLGFSVIPGLQASGSTLVATGAALATFGGALTALSGGGGSSAVAGGGGVVAGGDTGGGIGLNETVTEQTEEREPTQNIQLVVQGDILNADTGDLGRRLVDILNENFEREGSVITGASFA